jgi:hypothetical protein
MHRPETKMEMKAKIFATNPAYKSNSRKKALALFFTLTIQYQLIKRNSSQS